jgi:hypothetical protein
MSLKEQLAAILAAMPDDEPAAVVDGENGEVEATETPTEDTATGDETPSETTIEPSSVENTEVDAPPVDDSDITVITSDDMLEQTIDMRLASFYEKQQELENTVKILLQEVNTLKGHFETIETAIDTAAETSPTVESIENLINQL